MDKKSFHLHLFPRAHVCVQKHASVKAIGSYTHHIVREVHGDWNFSAPEMFLSTGMDKNRHLNSSKSHDLLRLSQLPCHSTLFLTISEQGATLKKYIGKSNTNQNCGDPDFRTIERKTGGLKQLFLQRSDRQGLPLPLQSRDVGPLACGFLHSLPARSQVGRPRKCDVGPRANALMTMVA
jgi:hypothetical protein